MYDKITLTGFVMLLVLFQYLTASSFKEMSFRGNHSEWPIPKSGEGDVLSMLESLVTEQRQLDSTLGAVRGRFQGQETGNGYHQHGTGEAGNDSNNRESYPARAEDAWIVPFNDVGRLDEDLLFDEQLKRFEASLTEKGREELQYQVETRIQQLATGTIPGFEGLGTPQPEDVAFLSAQESTLTPRQQKLRNGIFENFKRISLIEMHEAFTGLVTP